MWKILRIVGWSFAALMILAPLVAMQFTPEVDWSPGDFLFAILLLGGTGLVCELAIRRSTHNSYRTGALLTLATLLLLVWSNAAVGFVGSGANTANVLYVAMLAIPVIGGVISGFSARGMFLTTLLMAVVQGAIMLYAYAAGLLGEQERSGLLAITAVFILLWLGAAALFHQAAQSKASPGAGVWNSTALTRVFPIQFVLSLLLTAIGAVMLIFMITVEDEPGAVPLFMVLLGMGWFFVTVFRAKTSLNK